MSCKPSYEELEQQVLSLQRDNSQLREEERRCRSLMDEAPGLICTFLPDGEIVYVNQPYCAYFKKDFDELAGTSFLLLLPEPDRDAVLKNIHALTRENPTMPHEHQVVAADGSVRWQRWTNRAFFNSNGEAEMYQAVGEDVTERKLAAQAILKERKKFEDVLEKFPYGVCVVDENRRIEFVNKKIREEFGEPGDLLCHQYFKDMPGLCPACRTGAAFQEEFCKMEWRSQGKDRHYEVYDIPLKNENGSKSRVQIFNDITEQKKAESALQESEAKYRALVENAGEAIYIVQNGVIRFVNAKAGDFTGVDPQGMLARDMTDFIHPEDLALVTERHAQRLRGEAPPSSYSFRLLHESGHVRWVELSVTPIEWEGKPATLNFLRDISDRKKAENEIIEREKRFRATLDNMLEGCQIIGFDWSYIYLNDAAAKHGRMNKQDMTGKSMLDLYPGIEQTEIFALMQDGMINRVSHQVENVFYYGNGSNRWFELSIQPVPEGIFVLSIDVTERKWAEHSFKESESRFRTLFEQAPIGIIMVAPNGFPIRSNKALRELVGYTEKEICARSFLEWTHPDERKASQRLIKSIAAGEETLKIMEKRYLHKNGDMVWGRTAVTAVRNSAGAVEYFIAMVEDIRESKMAEQVLQDSENRYRSLFMHSPDAVFTALDGKVFLVNQACLNLFGAKKDEDIVGKPILDLVAPEFRSLAAKRRDILDAEGRPLPLVEMQMLRMDGKPVDVEVLTSAFSMGAAMATHVILRDISARKNMEKEKEQLQEQLSMSQKLESIGRLAGGVAHDLNNLLSPIIGFGEILSDDIGPDDPKREAVEEILGAGLRARNLVRQLLAFSRKQTLEFKPLDISKTLGAFKNLLRRTIPEDIEIRVISSQKVLPVMADAGQIEQVIMNLAVNAADAMPNGGVLTLETGMADLDADYAKLHSEVQPGRYAALVISDTGQGMDQAARERAFEPFFSTKGKHGTGLGLATVYGIVKQHGGSIWLYSEEGQGATFKIYLPVAEESPPAGGPEKKAVITLDGDETILLVEDNENVLHLAGTILKRRGYKTLAAKGSAEALKIIQSSTEPIHLLLTDVVMPEMNGRDLYNKALEMLPALKVLYMSGYTDNVIAHRGVLDEGGQFIQKPFSGKGLAQKVRKILNEK
ncbi:PAS/PAC sensor hybrid histidine kinase [Desulfatibacillum aliphaticivorans]|uniref:histidine kinase n=1 Tax=Desulfatibacillum aliphaticivorans TaxID=218208 RepID=B8FKK2_DESAL|nr:PAS domain S-box protein [Desulfatibacillum aliphaticivorans]ACL01817.1 PAS/PAC sensor hybrid histidine kinase [Desulfatibacillum aliphaticivorans]